MHIHSRTNAKRGLYVGSVWLCFQSVTHILIVQLNYAHNNCPVIEWDVGLNEMSKLVKGIIVVFLK